VETASLIILLFLILGVIGSIAPAIPGALFSLLATAIYITTNPDPSMIYILFSVTVAGFALTADWFAGSVAAKYGGASTKTSFMAGIAGIIGFLFFGGPIGMTALVVGTVYFREYMIHGDKQVSGKSALYSGIGVLGSTFIQTFLTFTVLLVYLTTLVL